MKKLHNQIVLNYVVTRVIIACITFGIFLGATSVFTSSAYAAFFPKGNLDVATCTTIYGWTCDEDMFSKQLRVEILEGASVIASGIANVTREPAVGAACGNGTSAHGFELSAPASWNTTTASQTHTITAQAYGVDSAGAETGTITQLATKTFTFTCTPPPLNLPPDGAFRQTGGVIFHGTGNPPLYGLSAKLGDLSVYNWKVNQKYSGTKAMALSYSALKDAATSANQPITTSTVLESRSLTSLTSNVYEFEQDVRILASTIIGDGIVGKKIIILGQKKVFIDGAISVGKGSTATPGSGSVLIIAAKGDIEVSKDLAASSYVCSFTGGQVQGVFSSENSFTVAGYGVGGCAGGAAIQDRMLIIDGTVIPNADNGAEANPGAFQNQRDLCENNATVPAVMINQRPDFILNMPDFAKNQNLIFSELAP